MTQDIRWKQRFEHFQSAFDQLAEGLSLKQPSALEKEGIIQRYEYTFELAWKTMKDFLSENGVTSSFPKEVIKKAFHYGLIEDGHVWIKMLDDRNKMSHLYDENTFREVFADVQTQYYPVILKLVQRLTDELQ